MGIDGGGGGQISVLCSSQVFCKTATTRTTGIMVVGSQPTQSNWCTLQLAPSAVVGNSVTVSIEPTVENNCSKRLPSSLHRAQFHIPLHTVPGLPHHMHLRGHGLGPCLVQNGVVSSKPIILVCTVVLSELLFVWKQSISIFAQTVLLMPTDVWWCLKVFVYVCWVNHSDVTGLQCTLFCLLLGPYCM